MQHGERPDHDVYSRSSGAAWSSAARAYFRKGVDDLPRGRARSAVGTGPRTVPPAGIGTVMHERSWSIVGRRGWPQPFHRLAFAFAGWLPPALALAYASASVSGCDRAAVSCPQNFELVQFAGVAALLLVLLALPRAAYFAAAGSAALGVSAVLMVVVYSVLGVQQPLPLPILLLTLALAVGGYAAGVIAAANDWPVRRPWLPPNWSSLKGPGPSLGVAQRAPRA